MKLKGLIWPLIKKNIGLFIAMIIISSLGIAINVASYGSYLSLKTEVDNYIEDYNYYDIIFNFDLVGKTKVNKEDLLKLDGVEAVNSRLTFDLNVFNGDKLLSARLFSVEDDSFMKFRTVEEVEKNTNYINISIDLEYSSYNNIHAGDFIDISLVGIKRTAYVNKVLTCPECLAVRKDGSLPYSSEFGYFYVDVDELKTLKVDGYANQALILVSDGYDNGEVLDEIRNIANFNTTNATIFENSQTSRNVDDNIAGIKVISNNLPIIFYLITLFVNVLFLFKVIFKYKSELGMLLMMGHSKFSIYMLFAILSFVISIPAIILGLMVGYLLNMLATYIYEVQSFSLVFKMPIIDIKALLIAALSCIAICILASLISTFLSISNKSLVEIVSKKPNNKLTYKGKGSPRFKIEMSRMIRNYKSFIISTICIIASTILIVLSISFHYSRDITIEDIFEKRMTYETQAFFSDSDYEKVNNDLKPYVTASDVILFSNTNVCYNDKEYPITINAIKCDSTLTHILDHHNIINLPKEGIVLDSIVASKLGVTIGDYVKINGYDIKVSGISEYDTMRMEYLSIDEFLKLNISYVTSIGLNAKDINSLQTYLLSRSDYIYSTNITSVKDGMKRAMASTDIAVVIISAMSVIAGFAIMINLGMMMLEDEKKTIATKRSMGFSILNISNEFSFELILKYIIGLSLGIIFGRIVSIMVFKLMELPSYTFPYVDSFKTYGITALLVLIFMLSSHMYLLYKINRLDLPEIIKIK